jgi:hypothetical protein
MTKTISVEQFRAMTGQGKRSKYGAVAVTYEGQRFHSKAELAFELHLKHLQALGKVAWWTRQVPFYLPGSDSVKALRYVADFLVVFTNGAVRIVDVKGMDTPNSKTKRAVIQATHNVKIELVRGAQSYKWSL